MYACVCWGLTEDQVRDLGRMGITAPNELIAALKLDHESCCGRCATEAERFVELAAEGARVAVPVGAAKRYLYGVAIE